MNKLIIVDYNGVKTVDSRQVAEMVGKKHKNLMRDIRGYCSALNSEDSNLSTEDFFVLSSYKNSQNKEQPCYLITHKGCDMVANKLTGKRGVIFTAEYVTAFDDMKAKLMARKIDSYMIEDPIKRAERWIEERKESDAIIYELKESNGFKAHEVTYALRELKNKMSDLTGRVIFAYDNEFMIAKSLIFKNFNVKKWEDIPSYKYDDVIEFIKNITLKEIRNEQILG